MNISKEEVLGILTTQPKGNIQERLFKLKFPEIYQEVLSMSFPEDFKFTQKLYHYFHNDPELKLGLCIICGNRCKFKNFNIGYFPHCSKECIIKDDGVANKRKQTNIERFGVENPFQSEEIKEKIKAFNYEQYGVPSYTQTQECKDKMKRTCNERFGCDFYSQTNEYKERFRNTCYEVFGVENPFQSEEIKEKIKETNLKKFNKENYIQSEDYKIYCRNKFGADSFFQSDEYKRICNDKWGVDNYAQSNEYKERWDGEIGVKSRQTCFLNYGVEYYNQSHVAAQTRVKQIPYKDLTFDSSWEVEVYKFCEEHNIPCEYQPNIQFIYECEGKEHRYQPDFLINGKVYEVKGEQFFEDGKMICPYDRDKDKVYESKHQCMLNNGVIILRRFEIKNLTIDIFS